MFTIQVDKHLITFLLEVLMVYQDTLEHLLQMQEEATGPNRILSSHSLFLR